MKNDLVQKVLRSVGTKRETLEELQEKYTKLYPPSFLFRGTKSITIQNLAWALKFLVQEGYVCQELTRFLEYELDRDTKVFTLTQKGLAYTLKKK